MRARHLTVVALLALTAAVTPGCYLDLGSGYDGDYDEPGYYGATYDDGSYRTLDVQSSYVSGDMGDELGFAGGAWMESGMAWGTSSHVEIHARDAGSPWAVMTIVEIEGDLGGYELGRVYTFDDTASYETRSAQSVRVMGCSGDEEGSWIFDQFAEETQVRVLPGSTPGVLRFDVRATFRPYDAYGVAGSAEQTTSVSFEVAE